MKKLITYLLIACTLISLVSCTADEPTETVDTSETVTSDVNENEFVFVENADVVCAIIVDSKYDKQALSLKNSLKEKLGVELQILRREKDGYKRYIYVGYDYNELDFGEGELSYMGYALVSNGGNIYICGYREDTLTNAIEKLVNQIIPDRHVERDATRRTQNASIPSVEEFFYSPEPKTADPVLISSSLSDYRIVISADANQALKELTAYLVEEIAEETHCFLQIVEDTADATDKEIVIGKTSRHSCAELTDGLAAEEYAIKSFGNSVYVAFGSFISYSDAISELKKLYKAGEEATIDISGSSKDYGLYRQNSSSVRIMTANVLFYANVNVNGFYKLSGKARQQINTDCFLAYMPDFIAVQEVDTNNRNIIEADLSEYYGVVNSGENKEGYDHIFYRKDKYNLEGFDWSKNPGSNGWYVMGRFSKKNVPDEQLIVVNLHISPYSTEDRLVGANAINEKLRELEGQFPNVPILVAGDYNSHIGTVEHHALFDGLSATMCAGRQAALEGADSAGIDHLYVPSELVTVERFTKLEYPTVICGSDHHFGMFDISVNG